VLLVLGLQYIPQFLPPRSPVKESAGPAVSAGSSASANRLEFSVFDQPRALPDISFADDEDHRLTLGDFRGRVILLNIWATWCVPCRKEMPALDRLQARLGSREFLVIPLSIDREAVAAVKRFYQEVGVKNLGVYVDPSGRGSRVLAIPGVPTTLLIDRQGREVARRMGEAQWDGPEMASLVERAIQEQLDGGKGGER
jgi:thiol-disulfide isomerase/thioredoxin